jgi:hypothetical protein
LQIIAWPNWENILSKRTSTTLHGYSVCGYCGTLLRVMLPATLVLELMKGRSVLKILCCQLWAHFGKLILNDR